MFNKKYAISNFMIISVGTYLTFIIKECHAEVESYLNVARPHVEYADPTWVTNISVCLRRHNRSDPYHYFSVEFTAMLKIDKHFEHSFNFYEVLSASSQKPIFELQYDFCDWAANDGLLGAVFREAYMKLSVEERPAPYFRCPFMPGKYSFKNLIMPMFRVPSSITFQNGRVYYKMSHKNKVILKGRGDFNLVTKKGKKAIKA